MTTSGTVAATLITTNKLVDHALLRVGKQPAVQTPQIVQQCQESLYLLLVSLASRGLNLWAVDKVLIGLVVGQPLYALPAGTLDVLNVIYSQPTLDPAAGVAIANGMSITPAAAAVRLGVQFGTAYTGTLTVDGISVPSATYVTGTWYWFDLPAPHLATLSVTGTAPNITALSVVTMLTDLPMTPMNRDSYLALPNKMMQARPCVNYFLEKKLTPQVTLWPAPNTATDALLIMRHRQVQDVGSLTQTIEVRNQWLEPIVWQLALRLVFELEGIDPARAQAVIAMADKYLIEGEADEGDGMPSRMQPRISPYTR